MLRARPVDTPDNQIQQDSMDLQHIQADDLHNSRTDALHTLIRQRQQHISLALRPERITEFKEYPKYKQLSSMATEGLRPFLKPNFTPNQGRGDFRRVSQEINLQNTIAQHVRKLQDNGRCLIFPLSTLDNLPGYHLSALHVVSKTGDVKGRPCSDFSHSGLNDGTDMDGLQDFLGDFHLPQLSALARMLVAAEREGNTQLYKTDVTSAFNTMMLHPEAALLQTFQVGELVVVPLVAGFGWCAAPAYYNVIAGAIDWAHNGGLPHTVLNTWAAEQNENQAPTRSPRLHHRSMTYVDDSGGQSGVYYAMGDMQDLRVILRHLLSHEAYNEDKTTGPKPIMVMIGWTCETETYTIQPGPKGICKLLYWVFRGLIHQEYIPIADLGSAVGTLRWYAAVVPMASTVEIQRLLTHTERRANSHSSRSRVSTKLTPAVKRELEWWQWILGLHLQRPILSCPAWFLANDAGDRPSISVYTDASTTIGGGYFIPGHTYGQFRWSVEEQTMYGGKADEDATPDDEFRRTDINGMEFVTAICAVVANRAQLRDTHVLLYIDNMAAVVWINKQRTPQTNGQAWIHLLVAVLLEYNILLTCHHIKGADNNIADALSRYIQDEELLASIATLQERPMLSAGSRRHIWSTLSNRASTEEWLRILTNLEQQE